MSTGTASSGAIVKFNTSSCVSESGVTRTVPFVAPLGTAIGENATWSEPRAGMVTLFVCASRPPTLNTVDTVFGARRRYSSAERRPSRDRDRPCCHDSSSPADTATSAAVGPPRSTGVDHRALWKDDLVAVCPSHLLKIRNEHDFAPRQRRRGHELRRQLERRRIARAFGRWSFAALIDADDRDPVRAMGSLATLASLAKRTSVARSVAPRPLTARFAASRAFVHRSP